MIAEQLRKSILQAAIEGRLTNQTPEDGDARDLLKEIQRYKTKLIQEGKLRKRSSLSDISEDEYPFDIPENWCWTRLSDISQILSGDRGKNYPGKEYWTPTGVPFVNAGCLESKYLSIDSMNFIPETRYKLLSNGLLEKYDILYCLRGSLGKISINNDFDRGAIASSLSIIRSYNSKIVEYLYVVLKSQYGNELIKKVNNGTAQPNIAAIDLGKYIIPFPPLNEQIRIVKRLEQLLPEIEKLEIDESKLNVIQKSFPKKMKDSILQFAIEGKLSEQISEDGNAKDLLKDIQSDKDHLVKIGMIKKGSPLMDIPEEEIPFEIPDSWCWTTLSQCYSSKTINDGDWILSDDMTTTEEVKLIQLGSIGEGMFNERGYKYISYKKFEELKCSPIYPGYLLINRMIGGGFYSCIIPSNIEGKLITSVDACWIAPINQIDQKYLLYILLSPYFKMMVNKFGAGTTRVRISKGNLVNILIPLPPLKEQLRIVKKIEQVLPLVESI